MPNRRIVWFALPFGLGLAAGCGGRRDSVFSPVELASAGTTRGAAPMFLVAPGGDRVLSWVADDSTAGREALFVEVTRAGSTTPEPVAVIRDSLGGIEPHGEAPPRLGAGSNGSLYALYTVGKEVEGERFPRSALRFVRSLDRGKTWSEPVSINEGERFGSHNFHALLAGQDGAVFVAWLSSAKGRSGVWLRRSLDQGTTWLAAQGVDTAEACPCCRTGLAQGRDGTVYLSWRKVFPGNVRDVVVMRSGDRGTTWEEPVRPRADNWVFAGCPHAGPSLAVDSTGAVHIAWWTGKEGEAGVYYARSTDGGRHFEPAPIATGPRAQPAHVQLATSGGAAIVAWDDGLSSTPRILLRASTDGARFGPERQVSLAGAATFPVLGVAGDSLIVAWSQVSEASHRHAVASRPNMSDPKTVMKLPRVGQSEIYQRRARVAALLAAH
jgi:hypothetical protein